MTDFLSTGRHYERIPKKTADNIEYRRDVVDFCRTNPRARKSVMQACSEDILFWINTFVWQFNPSKPGEELGPFISYDWQDPLIVDTLQYVVNLRRPRVWEKSRYQGASWMADIMADWLARFHPYKIINIVSHNQDAVDRPNDPNSMMYKIEFIDQHLPDWLPHAKKQKMGFTYPNGSAVFGFASTAKASVGGRAALMILDEFGLMANAAEILGNTKAVGPQLVISTHYGVGTEFYKLCTSTLIKKDVIHWTSHPDKRDGMYRWDKEKNRIEYLDDYEFPPDYEFVTDGSPTGGPFPGIRSVWYDQECRDTPDQRQIAQHVDIDPAGAGYQVFDPLMIRDRQSNWCTSPIWVGTVSYDSVSAEFRDFVKSPGGHLSLWLHLDKGKVPPGRFCAGADLSLGRGATPSVLSICNVDTGWKVAELVDSMIDPTSFATMAVALMRAFHGALLCWERNGPGDTFGTEVDRLRYHNVYRSYKDNPHTFQPIHSDRPGWNPTPENMRQLIAEYQVSLKGSAFINPSRKALEECLNFAFDDDNTPKHAKMKSKDPRESKVNHGDRVIADGLANKMRIFLGGSRRLQHVEIEDEAPLLSMAWRFQQAEERDRRVQDVWVDSFGAH